MWRRERRWNNGIEKRRGGATGATAKSQGVFLTTRRSWSRELDVPAKTVGQSPVLTGRDPGDQLTCSRERGEKVSMPYLRPLRKARSDARNLSQAWPKVVAGGKERLKKKSG